MQPIDHRTEFLTTRPCFGADRQPIARMAAAIWLAAIDDSRKRKNGRMLQERAGVTHHRCQPYCKIAFLERAGLGTRQTCSKYLRELERLGV